MPAGTHPWIVKSVLCAVLACAPSVPWACTECASIDGFVPPDAISDEVRMMVGKSRLGSPEEQVEVQKARGVIITGAEPAFIGNGACPQIDSEKWAIDYSHKRSGAALHKGVDIPQPRGTPIRAVADGTVVGRFLNDFNRKGIEIVLRHTPQQTGLGFWTYSQYTHLQALSPLPIGAEVRMGDEIGKTANTGKMGKRERRDAVHFAILYSDSPDWSNDGQVVMPKDGYFMDPVAFYRLSGPYDSPSVKALAGSEKDVPVPYLRAEGGFVPADTRRIWPYPCGKGSAYGSDSFGF
ncbi:MAG: M23 family metallopeptidase [Chromatiales bacterium]|nr:M23 family metallopeptidase [Chromatiales bacterium]